MFTGTSTTTRPPRVPFNQGQ